MEPDAASSVQLTSSQLRFAHYWYTYNITSSIRHTRQSSAQTSATTAGTEADTFTMNIFSDDEWQQLDEQVALCVDNDDLFLPDCSFLKTCFPSHDDAEEGEQSGHMLGNGIVEFGSGLNSETGGRCKCNHGDSTASDDDGKIGKPNEDTDHSNPACADTFVNAAIGADAQQTTRLTNEDILNTFKVLDIIAQELHAMSSEERTHIHEDITGGSTPCEETPEFLSAKLDDMEMELAMATSNTTAYNIARQTDQAYIEDTDLRLKFLRCTSFDSYKAAMRLIAWCDAKLHLFGPHVLGRDVLLSDLCPGAIALLEAGNVQPLPCKDAHRGRIIAATEFVPSMFDTLANARALFYAAMTVVEDVDAQKNGVVMVHDLDKMMPNVTQKQRLNMYICAQTITITPVNVKRMYLLSDDTKEMRAMVDIFQLSLARHTRHRFKPFFGTLADNIKSLSSHGVSPQVLPFDAGGMLKMVGASAWMMQRRALEAYRTAMTTQMRNGDDSSVPYDHPERNGANDVAEMQVVQDAEGEGNNTAVDLQLAELYGDIPETAVKNDIESPTFSTSPRQVSPQPSMPPLPPSQLPKPPSLLPLEAADPIESNSIRPSCSPTEVDILMGRGKPFQEHSGNQYMKAVIADMFDEYDKAPRWSKLDVAEKLVRKMQERKSRFLKQCKETGCWVEATYVEALDKAAHGFRKKREMDLLRARRDGRLPPATKKRTRRAPSKSSKSTKPISRKKHF